VVVFSAAVDGGKLMGYFNLAWFAWGSPETNLGDTVEYNTLVRVTSPYDRLATAIVKLFVYYNVRANDHFHLAQLIMLHVTTRAHTGTRRFNSRFRANPALPCLSILSLLI